MFMIHLCLLLCCVYVVLCWFFTSLVYVRLLALDLVPIDEALWVYLTYEVINGKEFTGKVCRFGEPVFGFSKVEGKGTARWSRMIFLGKSEPHDTYLFFGR